MIVPVADRLKHVEEYYFSKKLEQIAKMRSSGIDVINLGIGSPDLSPPEVAINVATQSMQQANVHGYSSYRSSPDLRESISKWLYKTYHININPDCEILPLLGSKEGILYLSMALLNPGDSVLIPNPGYPAYASVANLLGVKILYYNLTEENNWQPDLKEIESFDLSKCKLMWVNYPHMPSGASAGPELFTSLVEFAQKKGFMICNDNPYGLVLNTDAPTSLIKANPTMEVVCELNSFSKSFNMAGWRVGVFIGSQELVNAVISVKSNVDSGMFLPIQKGAIAALSVDEAWHEERNATYKERRKIIWEIFDLLGCTYSKNQVGLFIWAKAPSKILNVQEFIDDLLVKSHVFLTPGSIFGSNGNRYLRASLCSPRESLLKAKNKIEEYLK